MKKNNGLPQDYYSQRNNEYKKTINGKYGRTSAGATTMCNLTALCEGFDIAGWVFPLSDTDKYTQAEDRLMDFTIKEAEKPDSWFAQKMPALWRDWIINGATFNNSTNDWEEPYWPNEIHVVMAHYVNEWFGCSRADTFVENCSIHKIVYQLYNGIPVPISVKFGALNHIILLTGFENDLTEPDTRVALTDISKPLKIKNFIYDDPYGAFDWKTKTYPVNRGTGNDQILTYDQFLACAKPFDKKGAKYAHIIAKPAATV